MTKEELMALDLNAEEKKRVELSLKTLQRLRTLNKSKLLQCNSLEEVRALLNKPKSVYHPKRTRIDLENEAYISLKGSKGLNAETIANINSIINAERNKAKNDKAMEKINKLGMSKAELLALIEAM